MNHIYDIRKPNEETVWEYRDSENNILHVNDSSVDLESDEVQELLDAVGYNGPGDWKSA